MLYVEIRNSYCFIHGVNIFLRFDFFDEEVNDLLRVYLAILLLKICNIHTEIKCVNQRHSSTENLRILNYFCFNGLTSNVGITSNNSEKVRLMISKAFSFCSAFIITES